MLIDRHHAPWAAAAATVTGVATALYVPYHLNALNGTAGGTTPGLVFGVLGFLLLFAVGLLGFRRYVPAWRIGKMETWLRAHLWLGLIGSVLIVFHSGFNFGGPLTTALMGLLIVLNVSGLYGIVLQQVLPRLMTLQVPLETIYEQIEHVRAQLLAEAAKRVEAEGAPLLDDFYRKQLQPYLAAPSRRDPMSNGAQAAVLFDTLRTMVPPPLQETVTDLEAIAEECRQLQRQQRLHHWLHGWLLVHVPLSYAFLVLAVVHAVYSLGY